MHAVQRVRRVPQRMVGRQRLGIGHVEIGPGQPPALQRRDQRVLIQDVAARDVAQERARLHRVEFLLADQLLGLAGRWQGDHQPVELSQPRAPVILTDHALIRARASGNAGHLHAKGAQPVADGRANRAITQDQRLAFIQLAIAGRAVGPLMPIGQPHHLVIPLGQCEHAEHRIFGHGNRVDAHAIGEHHAFADQLLDREMIEPGIDGGEPFQMLRAVQRGAHRGLVVHVQPADFSVLRPGNGFLAAGKPVHVQPGGQMRFDQRAGHGGQDGFGDGGFPFSAMRGVCAMFGYAKITG